MSLVRAQQPEPKDDPHESGGFLLAPAHGARTSSFALQKWFGVANEAQKEACSFWRMSAGGEADAQQPEPNISTLQS